MKSNSRVYVIGHKNPDTDSICSAIAYADIKNRTDKTKTYVARRAGQINEETEYVLKRFGVRAPGYLPNAGTQVKEIEIHEVPSVPGTISVKKAYSMMKNNNVVTLPITSPDNDLQGVITVSDIAESYMDSYDSHVMSLARTQYRSIADTLDGSVIVGNEHGYFIRGKVVVGAFHPDTMENYIEKDDLVILGNRAEDQLCAIEMDASCIIVGLGAKVTKTIQKFAEEKCCVIISSPHDTYTIARLINQSIPVKYLMRRSNLITFNTEDFLDDIKEVMKNQRHRDFPILNKKGKYVGTISRRNLIGFLSITMRNHRRSITSKRRRFSRSSTIIVWDHLRRWRRLCSAMSRWAARERLCMKFIRKKSWRSRRTSQDCSAQPSFPIR